MTTRHPHLRTVGYVVAYALGALVLVGVLTAVAQTRELVGAVREQQRTNTGTVDLIKDCTQPDGDCFRDAQKRTSDAVADINKISVYAAACADEPGTQTASDIYACVVQRLADDDAKE